MEDLSKIIRRRRETILNLIQERERVRKQEPEKAEQIDARLKLEFEAIQQEVRSLRNKLVLIPVKTVKEAV